MRDVLITGGAGKIGYNLVEKLLDTNYSVTILDLESPDSLKKMLKIKDKVKFVYGDIEDANLVRDLVKRNDIVIDYAGIMPPLANLNENISNASNFLGTKNVVDAINETNPNCIYIYASFISVYGTTLESKRKLTVDSESTHPDDFYSVSLIRSEEYIRSNLKKYTIIRMPIVLTRKNYFINHLALGRTVDFITKEDFNDIVISIMKSKKSQGKIYNVSGFKAKSEELVEKLYKQTGTLSILNRNLYYGEYVDGKELGDQINLDYTDLDEALSDMKKDVPDAKRAIKKVLNYPKYIILKFMKKTR